MSKPRYRWWSFARRMVLDYPGLKKNLDDLHEQSITANLSGMPRGGGTGRTVEGLALRQLGPGDQKVYDAVSKAISITAGQPAGDEHLQLIKLMYWSKRNLPAKHAALRLNISYVTAKRWHGSFVRLVGFCYGLEDDTPEPK